MVYVTELNIVYLGLRYDFRVCVCCVESGSEIVAKKLCFVLNIRSLSRYWILESHCTPSHFSQEPQLADYRPRSVLLQCWAKAVDLCSIRIRCACCCRCRLGNIISWLFAQKWFLWRHNHVLPGHYWTLLCLENVVSFGINLGPNFEITNAIATRANVLSLQNYPLQTKIAKIPVIKMDSIWQVCEIFPCVYCRFWHRVQLGHESWAFLYPCHESLEVA